MKCAGCSNDAKYLLFSHQQPHCTSCMLDAMCSEPTDVIEIESWEVAKKREQRVSEVA